VGLVAAGGYGKSALAWRLGEASESSQKFSHKIWATFSEPYAFGIWGRWVLAQLDRQVQEQVTDEDLVKALTNRLAEVPCLVVMDNLETLLTGTGDWQQEAYQRFLQRWLGMGGASVVMVTSREQPKLPDNALNRSRWCRLQGLETAAGIALLQQLQVEGTEPEFQAFVEQVEGHPLVLDLVAGFLKAEQASVGMMERQTVNWLEVAGQHRDDPEATVAKVLAWSVERLSPGWRQLVLNLSVLRLGFGWQAAKALCPEPEWEETEAGWVGVLRGLARRSLLQEERRGEEWQFRFLPLIQGYLQECLGEATETQEQAIRYYWASARSVWSSLEDVTEHLEIFHHCCELKGYERADQLLGNLDEFLRRRGYSRVALELNLQLLEKWQLLLPSEEQAVLTGVWNRLGNAYDSLGQYQRAIDFHQQHLEISRKIGDRQGEANSLGNLGIAYKSLGQYQRAIDFHQQLLEISREIGYRQGEAASLGNLGNAYHSLGQYQRAIDFHQQHLDISREIGDRQGEANSLGNLGNAYHSLGQYQRTIDFHQQSLEIKREIGDRQGEANSLGNLGIAYNSLGQYQRAIYFHQQSLEIKREIGDR
jgi:tetratricopeptide (TPR) repeat protein